LTTVNPTRSGPVAQEDPSPASHMVQVDNLSVRYGDQEILRSLSFAVAAGQTLVILGESGCGKTTLLRALTGLIPVTTGDIQLDATPISTLSPKERRVIYLDQEPLLFEHLNVSENIAFAMRLRQAPANEVGEAVKQMLQSIDLGSHSNKREWQLSGGQKQRVAFARAVLARPKLLLLDEPFCSLDSKTRGQMQGLFATLCQQHALTSIFVTHDVKEALVVGNRFARMTGGKLLIYPDRASFINDQATGIPEEIAFWRRSAELLE
jgi:heme ABC exporter ATP-binding subunit CcmA